MIKTFYNLVLNDSERYGNQIILSFSINLLLLIFIIALTVVKPIALIFWALYKLLTVLIVSFIIFSTLKKLKLRKIINDDNKINKDIKEISNTFIFTIMFSNTFLFILLFCYISNLSKFSWQNFVKNIESKSESFNDYVSSKFKTNS